MVKVLLTGTDAIIGAHLVEIIVDKGYQIKAISQYNSCND
jgi:hypothetical protein